MFCFQLFIGSCSTVARSLSQFLIFHLPCVKENTTHHHQMIRQESYGEQNGSEQPRLRHELALRCACPSLLWRHRAVQGNTRITLPHMLERKTVSFTHSYQQQLTLYKQQVGCNMVNTVGSGLACEVNPSFIIASYLIMDITLNLFQTLQFLFLQNEAKTISVQCFED